MEYMIKLKKKHPSNAMYMGSHKINTRNKRFDISEKELFLLETDEAKTWFSIVQVKDEPKKVATKKKPTKKKITKKKIAKKVK